MNTTTNLTAAAAGLGLVCFTLLAALGRIDGTVAVSAIQVVLAAFIGGASLHGAAQHFGKGAAVAAPVPDAKLAELQKELDALKIGIGK